MVNSSIDLDNFATVGEAGSPQRFPVSGQKDDKGMGSMPEENR